jgi:hypothetical protein
MGLHLNKPLKILGITDSTMPLITGLAKQFIKELRPAVTMSLSSKCAARDRQPTRNHEAHLNFNGNSETSIWAHPVPTKAYLGGKDTLIFLSFL